MKVIWLPFGLLKADRIPGKDGKRYMKALREEARAGDNALKTKMKELERLQKVHKQAAKVQSVITNRGHFHSFCQDEAAAMASHSKAIKDEHKLDMTVLSARTKHESALADLKAKEDALNATKRHVGEQSQLLQEKQREFEELRSKKAVEDVSSFLRLKKVGILMRMLTQRERVSKIKQFTISPAKPSAP